MSVCPGCGTEIPAGYVRCPQCGGTVRPQEIDELAKIDYLLDALEQARANGDLSGSGISAYAILTRRYLARGQELRSGVQGDPRVEAAPATPALSEAVVQTLAAAEPLTSARLAAPGTGPDERAPEVRPSRAATPRPPSGVALAARSVSWTVWAALVGALLVVAAGAAFAIFAGRSLTAGSRLGILLAVTVAVYAGGFFLRRRLTVIGVSLLAVGAALILVDGWLLLSTAGLHSLWWWALLFAVGSAVHWEMGVLLRSRLFAASGAVAQITWWWLLGTALSWPPGARAAVLTSVAFIWTLAAPPVRRGAARPIGEVLGLAGPVLAAGAAVAAFVGVLLAPGWSALAVAVVVAVTVTGVSELQKLSRAPWASEVAALAVLPLPAALLTLPAGVPAWSVVVLLCVAGLLCLVLSAGRGGNIRAIVGLFMLLAAPAVPGATGEGGSGPWIGAVASWLTLGTVAVVAGSLLSRAASRRPARQRSARGIADAGRMLHLGGWVVLLGTSALQLAALRFHEPLMGRHLPSTAALTPLAAEAAAAWLISTAVRSKVERSGGAATAQRVTVLLTAAGMVGYAWTQVAAALAVRWIAPEAGRVWYSFVMLGLAAMWSHTRTLSMRRLLDMSSQISAWLFGLSTVGSVGFTLAPVLRSTRPGLALVLLAALAALLWGLEAWRFRERIFIIAVCVAASVAAGLAAWTIAAASVVSSRAVGGLAALGAGAVIAVASRAQPGTRQGRLWWSLGGVMGAVAGLVGAFSASWSARPALAVLALALLGPALAGLAGFAGLSAFAAFAALSSLESWARVSPWIGTVVAIVAAAGMLAPAAVRRGRPQPPLEGTWSLALAGVVSLAGTLLATGVAESGRTSLSWLRGGAWGAAVLLCALAAYCAGWSLCARTKWGRVAGSIVFLAALLMFLAAAGVKVPEPYFLVTAVWCGVVAWRLWRLKSRPRLTMAVDILAVLVSLGGPALLMMASGLHVSSTSHAIWLIGLGACLVGAGILLRVRLYFGFGLGGVVLAAFWLTSSYLSAVPSVVALVAIVGGALIALGAAGERRRARFTKMAKNAFAGWR